MVWLDFEKRKCSLEAFKLKIKTELIGRGACDQKISICIPNRMTENIILADEQIIREALDKEFCYSYEGQNGKDILETLYKAQGRPYKETSDGVALLKKIRLRRAAEKSPSARDFLVTFDHSCWWVDEEPLP